MSLYGTRDEHLQACKERALEYLDDGDVRNAIASMLSDLNKHPGTRPTPQIVKLGVMVAGGSDMDTARRFITDFK
jgi:hypothetical protein